MDINESFDLLDKYRYLAELVAREFYCGKIDFERILDYATDGLMGAINSIENAEQLDNIDFKKYASFHIKSKINEKMNEDTEDYLID